MRTRRLPEDVGTQQGSVPVTVTVVESESCHYCADAQQVIADAAARFPVDVRTVDVRSREGQSLMHTHRAAMSPLVLLDGVFFSHGRLSRHKLEKVLCRRFPGTAETMDRLADGRGRG
jgi:glutaredoxin